jgi:MYXO-CTERM domain-containing protein
MNTTKNLRLRMALILGLGLPVLWPTPASAAPGTFDLNSPGNGAWCTATCTFSWQAAAQATSYQLWVDGALKRDSIVPTTLEVTLSYTLTSAEALSDGWHTWSLVAKDAGGATKASNSTYSVQVDGTAPTAPTLVSPAADEWMSSDAPAFAWTPSTDALSGLASYEVWIDGSAAKTGISATATTSSAPMPRTAIVESNFNVDCPSGWSTSSASCKPYAPTGTGSLWIGSNGKSGLTQPIALQNYGATTLRIQQVLQTVGGSVEVSLGGPYSDPTIQSWFASNAWTWLDQTYPIDDFATNTAFPGVGVGASGSTDWYISYLAITGILGGAHSFQVVAVDAAGNRTASETRSLRYDAPPLPFDVVSPTNHTVAGNPKPTFTWTATTDAGSGLAKYQLWVDGQLVLDNIPASATSATPTVGLTDGAHGWRIYAVTTAGAVRHSHQSWALTVDTTPPAAFSLASPADGSVSATPTPSLCWNRSSDSGSGLDHYQLVVDGTVVRDGIIDPGSGSLCATPTAALAVGSHTWSANAVDEAGNARASTETWTIYFGVGPEPGPDGGADASVDAPRDSSPDTVPILSGSEVGPETGPEPSPDTGLDLPTEAGPDASTATAISTATGTATTTQTSSSTTTSTATGTSVSPEPRPDGAPVVGSDAPILMADAATSDATIARDGFSTDGLLGSADAWTAKLGIDASTGSNLFDGGLGLADASVAITSDAKVAASDGGRSGSADGSRYDAGDSGKSGSSGCGCAVGGHDACTAWGLPVMVLGLLAFWRGSRPRRREPRTWQS